MFELDHRLLDRHAAEAEFLGDLVAVDPIPGAQLAGQYQVDHVRDHLVLFFDPVFLGHGAEL